MDSGGCSAFILFTTPPMRVLGLPGLHLPMLKPTNPVLRWSQQSLTQIEMLVHRDILPYHNSRRQDFYLPDCGSFCYRTCMVIDLDSKFIHHFGQKTTSWPSVLTAFDWFKHVWRSILVFTLAGVFTKPVTLLSNLLGHRMMAPKLAWKPWIHICTHLHSLIETRTFHQCTYRHGKNIEQNLSSPKFQTVKNSNTNINGLAGKRPI